MRSVIRYSTVISATLLLSMQAMTPAIGATAPAGGEIAISMPWARATPPVANVGAVYFELKAGSATDRLVGAFSNVAERVEFHTTVDNKGVMQMRPLRELSVVSGKPLILAPGGIHLMLIGLRAPLVAGMRFPLTLRFASAGDVTIEVAVLKDAPVAGHAVH